MLYYFFLLKTGQKKLNFILNFSKRNTAAFLKLLALFCLLNPKVSLFKKKIKLRGIFEFLKGVSYKVKFVFHNSKLNLFVSPFCSVFLLLFFLLVNTICIYKHYYHWYVHIYNTGKKYKLFLQNKKCFWKILYENFVIFGGWNEYQ